MFIYTKIQYKWTPTGELVVDQYEGFEYGGPLAECKGDSVAKQQEQNQLNFNNQLMSIFQQQYGKQAAVLDFLKGKLQPMIENPTGYDPATLAAMRTSATDNLSTSYNNASKALQGRQFITGRDLPSGVQAQQSAQLATAEASDKANAQNTITMNDANLKNTNYWNAMNVLSGNVASQFNPLGYANSATSGANAVANLSQAVTASQQSGLLGTLGGIAGGVLGSATTNGWSKLFCWIAAKIFGGWDDIRTRIVRSYLLNSFGKTWYGRPIIALYARFGERASKIPLVVTSLRPLFALALDQATAY